MTEAPEPWDVAEMHARALRICGGAFASITSDVMDESTPGANGDVRTLANRVIGEMQATPRLLAGEDALVISRSFRGDLLGADPTGSFEAAARAAADAVYAPGAMRADVEYEGLHLSGEAFAARRTVRALVDGWDIAQVTDEVYRVPSDLAAMAFEHVSTHPEHYESSDFGAAIPAAADAGPWARTLALLGRKERSSESMDPTQ